jgi:hypothetical protein
MVELYSRTVRIGTPHAYRDIAVHEMTESEIRWLKESRWVYVLIAFSVGFIVGGVFTLLTGPYPKF